MKLTILAIGRQKPGPEKDLVDDYLKRLNGLAPTLGIARVEVREFELKKRAEGETRKRLEGELLLDALPTGARVIALDERGKSLPSTDFARLLEKTRDDGVPELCFLIGGADGFSDAVKARADRLLSFSSMTWPHMLVRVMICEQVYRGVSILAGHPYHRA